MATPQEIELSNLRGEVRLLRTVCQYLLAKVGEDENLEQRIDGLRARLGEHTQNIERIPFEHAVNLFRGKSFDP